MKATFSAVLAVFIPQIAFSRPLSEISGYPAIPNSQVHSLICYIETQEGQTLNLGRLCGEVPLVNETTSGVATPGLTSSSSSLSSDANSTAESRISTPGLTSGSSRFSDGSSSVGNSGGGKVPLANNVTSGLNSGSGGSSSSSSGFGSSGNCDYPWQTDSSGRSCGDRAASVRSGGSSVGTGSSTGSIRVRGYTRSDGTRVRGYTRRR